MIKLIVLLCLAVTVARCQDGGNLEDLIDSVFAPGGQPGGLPGGKPGGLPGGQPGGLPGGKPGGLPGGQPGGLPGGKPGGNTTPINPRPVPGTNPCRAGECVPFYQCNNGTIITDGDGLLDIRFGEENGQTELHPCTGTFQTCCTLRSNEPNIPVVDIPQTCGVRNVDGVGFRITGGKDNEAQFAEFPWTVAIMKEEVASGMVLSVYQCGGSLIHPSVVLTAAHCVSGKEARSLKIRAGEWDAQTRDEIFPHQDRNVAEIVVHENYYKGGLFNDVALLFLAQPVQIAENVNTICLPPQDSNFDLKRCFASGWGKDKFGKGGIPQVILKRVELPIVPRDQCQSQLRTTRLGTHFELNRSFICAGGESGRDTCKGDGGSPLVCPIAGTVNQYYQAGIVAWGIGCGDNQTPGVYVNVPLFRNWIDAKVQARSYKPSSYIHA